MKLLKVLRKRYKDVPYHYSTNNYISSHTHQDGSIFRKWEINLLRDDEKWSDRVKLIRMQNRSTTVEKIRVIP